MGGREMNPSNSSQRPGVPGTAGGLPVPLRLPLLALGFVALFAGILAGLARLVPLQIDHASELAAVHGPLMICGFLGTVIGLERAVALSRRWAFAGPLATALGGASLIAGGPAGVPELVGPALFFLGSLILCLANGAVLRLRMADDTIVMALGALAWAGGNLLSLSGAGFEAVVPLWAAFLILTIAGERLELSRLMPPTRFGRKLFALVVAVLGLGALLAALWGENGEMLFGAGLIALAAWLVRYDVARRTVRTEKLPRFIAICLLSGYAWLALAGVLILASGGISADRMVYDGALHAIFLGFVFSMIFGHAPVILPAVTTFQVPYRPWFYLHLALLHLSLALRLVGDLTANDALRGHGGHVNAAAIILFVVATVSSAIAARLARSRKAALASGRKG